MTKFFVRPVHSWFLIGAFMTLMLVLSACGGGGGTGTSGGGNGSGSGGQTVHVKETKAAGQDDQYMCDPTSITVKKGDTVTIVNDSDENQDFDEGDAQKAGVDVVVAVGASKGMTFPNAGTFTIKSEKGATLTVTVQ